MAKAVNTRPKPKRGNCQVTMFCCTSGLCMDCHVRGNHGCLDKRQRVVHTHSVSWPWARFVASGFAEYGAQVELMPRAEG